MTGTGDRVVEAGRLATVAQLAAALAPPEAAPADSADSVRTLRVDRNGAVLAPDRAIVDLDLRSGDRVRVIDVGVDAAFDQGPDSAAKPWAVLRMLTGPLAGESFQLPAGTNSVGRTTDNDLPLKDPGISRHHASIAVDASAVVVTDLGSTNGIRIEGLPIDGPTALRSGQRLLLGQSWVAVDHHGVPVVPVEGRIGFDRPQRMVLAYQGRTFLVPRPREGDDGAARRGPLGSRMQGRQNDRVYTGVIDKVVADINLARREEREARSTESPSVEEVLLGVRSQTRLWERRLTDPDVLQVRLGLAELPSRHRIEVEAGGPPTLRFRVDRLPQTYSTLDGVPATLDLGRPGGLRLQGAVERIRPIAAAVVAQLVGLNPPDQLGLILHGDAVEAWDWLKWLPHVALTGSEPPTGAAACALLEDMLAADPGDRADDRGRPPFVVVVVDGAADEALLTRLQVDGPSRGVHPLIVDGRAGRNGGAGPDFGVGAVLTVEGPTARLTVPGDPSASVDPIAAERLETETAIEFGRLLAPLSMGRLEGAIPVDEVTPEGDDGEAGLDDDDADASDLGEADAPDPGKAPDPGETGDPAETGEAGLPPAEEALDRTPDPTVAAPTDCLTVAPLVLGPAPAPDADPLAPPDLFELPRSTDDSRLVLGRVRIADEGETILAFSPPRDGTLALVGGPRADLTGCLFTVAASVARFDGPVETRPLIYTLAQDPSLLALGSLPVSAGIGGPDPTEAADRLAELEQRMADRLLTFELAGVGDVDGFRDARPGIALRRILVVIDGLGWLTSLLEPDHPGRTRQVVGQLLEIGASLGLHVVFAVEDRDEVDPLLAPKVGRWLEIDGGDNGPGRVRLDGADVRFAAPGGSWEPAQLERAMARLAEEIVDEPSVMQPN